MRLAIAMVCAWVRLRRIEFMTVSFQRRLQGTACLAECLVIIFTPEQRIILPAVPLDMINLIGRDSLPE